MLILSIFSAPVMTYVYLDCRLGLRLNKTEWPKKATDNVAPINNIVNSLISSLSIRLNDVLINNSNDYYYDKSFIQVRYYIPSTPLYA